jgi:cytoskeleton protein RodZ
MVPIGEQLKAAREQKGLAIDRVADDTNIGKRYLAALEAEDFSVFPGDTYAIGFLRNYADYLGLPPNELVAAYKNHRIQEQPIPVADLLPKRGPAKSLVVGIALGGAVLVGLFAFLAFFAFRGARQPEPIEARAQGPVEYRIEGPSFQKRLYVGDSLLVSSGTERYQLLVARIDDALTLRTPSGESRLVLGEEATIDLDKSDPAKGALVRLEFANPEAALEAASEGGDPAVEAAAKAGPPAPSAPLGVNQPETPAPIQAGLAAGGKSVVLFDAAKSPYPFVLSVTFRGSSMFRYEIDKRDRDERYYRKGETITVNANNTIKVWASNAQSAKLTVQASGGKSVDLDIGGPGEVAVKRIAWSQADSGSWSLGAYDVD